MTNQYYYYVIMIYFLCFRTFMDVLNVVIKLAKYRSNILYAFKG